MGINVNDVEVLKNVSSILDDSVTDRPVRLSSRLAQIKIKETAVTHKSSLAEKSADPSIVHEKKYSKKAKKNIDNKVVSKCFICDWVRNLTFGCFKFRC